LYKRDCIDKIKGKTTAGNQKARTNAYFGIAQQEGQVPKHTKGKQPGEQLVVFKVNRSTAKKQSMPETQPS
jgi:hypothetical protein